MDTEYKDYYKILGVDRKATEQEIKSAYRKAARKHHPDLHVKSEKAASEEKFKELNEAYTVLGDKDKRKQYDQLGEDIRSGRERPSAHNTGGFTQPSWSGTDAGGFSEFFESLFGHASPGGRRGGFQQSRSVRGPNLESELEMSLEDAFRGGQKPLQYSFRESCPACGGIGSVNSGVCQNCGGAGSKSATRSLDVKIPPFVRDGNVIRLKGQGGTGTAGGEPGDLLLTVRILPDKNFTFVGNNLESTISLRPEQAVLGCKICVQTMEGEVTVTVPPMTHSNQKLRLRSKGWRDSKGTRGDQYVKIVIDIPRSIRNEERELYQLLADHGKEVNKQ